MFLLPVELKAVWWDVCHGGTAGDALLCCAGRGPPCSIMLRAGLTMSIAVLLESNLPAGLHSS